MGTLWREAFEKMLEEYYQIVGRIKKISIPTRKKLMELRMGKLVS